MSRSSGGTKVFMGRLPYDTRTRDIEKFFREYGFSRSIRDITVKTGYAFVDFDDSRDADDAVYELNRKELLGSRITLEHARPGGGRGRDNNRDNNFRDRSYREYRARPTNDFNRRGRPYNTEWRIIVENLSSRCGWQDLKDFFREAGEVTFTKCHKERVGEGVVEFARRTDMKTALRKMDGKELYGKKIRLIDDSPKDARDSASPRRSNSRSRSRSRSRRSRSHSRSPSRGRSAERSRSASPRRRSFSKSHSKSPAAPRYTTNGDTTQY